MKINESTFVKDVLAEAAIDESAENHLIQYFRENADSFDPWGSVMGALFDIAHELHHRNADIPSEWEFNPGMGSGDLRDHESSHFEEFAAASESDLIELGNMLNRASDILRAQGKDY
jgi:hypothetical protein